MSVLNERTVRNRPFAVFGLTQQPLSLAAFSARFVIARSTFLALVPARSYNKWSV